MYAHLHADNHMNIPVAGLDFKGDYKVIVLGDMGVSRSM